MTLRRLSCKRRKGDRRINSRRRPPNCISLANQRSRVRRKHALFSYLLYGRVPDQRTYTSTSNPNRVRPRTSAQRASTPTAPVPTSPPTPCTPRHRTDPWISRTGDREPSHVPSLAAHPRSAAPSPPPCHRPIARTGLGATSFSRYYGVHLTTSAVALAFAHARPASSCRASVGAAHHHAPPTTRLIRNPLLTHPLPFPPRPPGQRQTQRRQPHESRPRRNPHGVRSWSRSRSRALDDDNEGRIVRCPRPKCVGA